MPQENNRWKSETQRVTEALREAAIPLTGGASDYDRLMEMAGDARFVLIGEASHGTHEFYKHRAEITKRLIREKGFTIIAVEADWPDAYRINRYVRGDEGQEAIDALGGFVRFPSWMWRNADVLDFIGWLRDYNDSLPAHSPRTGFYGIDLYSLHTSIEEVIGYLDKVDPEAARRARNRYACFDHYGEDTEAYGFAAMFDLESSCADDVVAQLVELQRRRSRYHLRDGEIAGDEYFYAEQNARLVKNAEEYYRSMFLGHVASWNLRDTHMAEMLEALVEHGSGDGAGAKAVVWAHNSHLGDARATEMSERDELNLGELIRTRHPDSLLVGFSTYSGTVTASTDWSQPPERKTVRPGMSGSYEYLFHTLGLPSFLLPLREPGAARNLLSEPRLERAIGVIYRPDTERISHYFHARLAEQFDAIIHIDTTRAVEPLERPSGWTDHAEPPETFPSGL